MKLSANVTVKSSVTPDFSFNTAESAPKRFSPLKFIRPAVDLDLPVVGKVHYAPWGEPSAFGGVVVWIIAGLAAVGFVALLRRKQWWVLATLVPFVPPLP